MRQESQIPTSKCYATNIIPHTQHLLFPSRSNRVDQVVYKINGIVPQVGENFHKLKKYLLTHSQNTSNPLAREYLCICWMGRTCVWYLLDRNDNKSWRRGSSCLINLRMMVTFVRKKPELKTATKAGRGWRNFMHFVLTEFMKIFEEYLIR